MPTTVSVALCTHNGARFVGEQLRSIFQQTRPVTEVVLSDDASQDDTIALVERLWGSAPHPLPVLKIIRNEKALGVTRNFEQAVIAASGELVALCDQDDVWAADRVALMAAQFEARPGLGALFTNARLVDAAGQSMGTTLFEALEISRHELARVRDGHSFDVLLRRNIATGATMMFRRSLIESAIPFATEWVHDEWLAIIAAAVSEIDWMPDPLTDYRQHGENNIGATAPTLRYKFRRVLAPRGNRYTNLVDRAQQLDERLSLLDVSAEVSQAMAHKLIHQQRRAELPSSRLSRIVPIIREARTGRYTTFSSQGRLDIVRDLVQPDR
ncbi:MAG: glycosyltransferase family 2 protein [Rhodoglobus sp.]